MNSHTLGGKFIGFLGFTWQEMYIFNDSSNVLSTYASTIADIVS